MLVLDEADRILDMGFEEAVNAVVEALPGPEQRQTLLFSATQTRSVRDLARLSLRDAEYLAVHEKSEQATPESLVGGGASVEALAAVTVTVASLTGLLDPHAPPNRISGFSP